MALFMPTNITPSTLGALGNGTVDAGQNMTVTWQVDGQNAMTAFEVKILANTAESAQLYDSGKRTDNCPFYGRNAKGDVVVLSYTITAAALAAAAAVDLERHAVWREEAGQTAAAPPAAPAAAATGGAARLTARWDPVEARDDSQPASLGAQPHEAGCGGCAFLRYPGASRHPAW